MKLLALLSFVCILHTCSDIPSKVERDNPKDPKAEYDNNPPQVNFKVTPPTGLMNETLFLFDANAIEPELPGTPLYYKWDFDGDGGWNQIGYQIGRATHKYRKSGYIKPTVTVEGGKGLSTTKTFTVYVVERPYCDFAWKKTSYGNYQLDGFLSHDFEGTNNLQYRWDLNNDGNWDTNFTSDSKYNLTGNYDNNTIRLQVKDFRNYTSIVEKRLKMFDINEAVVNFPLNGDFEDIGSMNIIGNIHGATLTKDRTGNDNGAYYFDGINDYVDLGNQTELKPLNNFLVSFWVNFEELDRPIFSSNFEDSSTTHGYYSKSTSYGSMYFGSNSVWTFTYPYVILPNLWYHVACNYSTNGWVSIYINGKHNYRIGASNNPRNVVYNTGPFVVGKVASKYFKGTLDNLIIFNRTLSQEEIYDLYQMLD